jgi:divalent metal cation (Fe/Co/Zn/Cd) transporter
MEQLTQLRRDAVAPSTCPMPAKANRSVMWLQSITIGWMLVECAGAIFAAARAHSVALLAFGSDSLVELFSATIVLLQFTRIFHISLERAARMAGGLLFVLAGVVGLIAFVALAGRVKAERSLLGISITVGALLIMPILARLKRRKAIETGDRALAADAVQSAACAYLAALTLAALCLQAFFPLRWLDPIAALCAIPFLIVEGRRAFRDESCSCC